MKRPRFSPWWRPFFGAMLSLACAAPWASAQETAAAQPAAESFADVLKRWKDVNQTIDSLGGKLHLIEDEDEQRQVFSEYAAAAEAARAMLPKLRAAALAEYQRAPNQNAEATRLLIGLAAYDTRQGQFARAQEVIRRLTEGGCKEKALHHYAALAAYGVDDFDAAAAHFAQVDALAVKTSEGFAAKMDLPAARAAWKIEQELRAKEAAANDLPRARLTTTKGDIVLELFENQAPQTVGNFVHLVEKGFYNDRTFHRVIAGFMAQGGDPQGDGTGGPGYTIYCECEKPEHRNHFRGSLAMAHSGPNTGGSQFYLTFQRAPHLDGKHTVFGRVIEGLEVLDSLQITEDAAAGKVKSSPDRIIKAVIERKRDHVYEPTKVNK